MKYIKHIKFALHQKHQNKKMLSAAKVRWRFEGYIIICYKPGNGTESEKKL